MICFRKKFMRSTCFIDAAPGAIEGGSATVSPGAAASTPEAGTGSGSDPGAGNGDPTPSPFAGMDGDDLDVVEIPADTGLPADGAIVDSQAKEQPKAPVVQDAKAPVPPVPAVVPPKVEATPAPQPPKETPAATAPPPSEIDSIVEGLTTNAKALQEHLAANVYSLTAEEKVALDTDAVAAIPGIMARVHMEGAKSTLKQIQAFVPKMVEAAFERLTQTKEKGKEATDEFYKAFPKLEASKHAADVDLFAKAFRSLNPKASRQEAIQFVGNAIHAKFGIPTGPVPAPNGGLQTPPPFAPARPGARQMNSQVVDDAFGGLGADHEEGG